MKRVFCKFLGGDVGPYNFGVVTDQFALWEFLAEEDIDIIAVLARCETIPLPGNDGFATIAFDLSQVAVIEHDGAISRVSAQCWWNTTPASAGGWSEIVALAFPEGYAVPIREEGSLYVNVSCDARDLTAGTVSGSVQFLVFYTKKTSRK